MDPYARLIRIQEARRRLDGADVQLNHRLERENRLLDSMQRQNRQAKREMIRNYGVPYKPADPTTIPKPINFRAEGVDIQGLLKKHRAGKKIGSTNLARLKARGLVKRADGTKVDKGNRGKS